ncbi:hypothetical protein Zmor_024910 [Zophobas morio]|uniref:Little elongation complex subunit 2 C-terminal domain-containing protein n=1 Tax=Zophobas morio TaxID=2755281 RepID=A0AA38HR46_9CUCU|nr:hypothetical protein Zmor_024910 [Zophobas morio]
MNEFLKLSWRKNITDEEFDRKFLTDAAVADLYVYKSFDKPINSKPKKSIKLHLANKKHVPGLKYHRLIKRKSLLTKITKFHCLEALKVIQSGKRQDLLTRKETNSLTVYNKCHSKIVEENRLFNEYIRNVWLKHRYKEAKTRPGIYNYAWNYWKEKMGRYLEYPQYYKQCETLCLNFEENEASVDFQHVIQPLETGTLARYVHANLKEQCILKLNVLRKLEKQDLLNSKLPVSQDKNINKLAQSHNFDVAISSSGLKRIIDYTSVKDKWLIPVVIKEIQVDKGGTTTTKKIVFVDKVLPDINPTVHDLNKHTYKRLLRLNFCQYEAFSYPVEEVPIEGVKEESIKTNKEEDEKMEELPINEKQEKNRVIHHNVNYRIWNIKKCTIQNTLMKNQVKDKEINLLVRCKLDGCEATEQGVLYPVIVRPKIEQQVQYGVNIPSKSELARDWTCLFFRLYSVLYRARIYNPTTEIIAVEKCSIQKINVEAHTHYEYKPILGLGVLQKILSRLITLDCGTYLLQHLPKQESFISLLKQCDNEDKAFDLHTYCAEPKVDTKRHPSWLPIDVNYILPVHEEKKTIPGLFHGFDNAEPNRVSKNKKY